MPPSLWWVPVSPSDLPPCGSSLCRWLPPWWGPSCCGGNAPLLCLPLPRDLPCSWCAVSLPGAGADLCPLLSNMPPSLWGVLGASLCCGCASSLACMPEPDASVGLAMPDGAQGEVSRGVDTAGGAAGTLLCCSSCCNCRGVNACSGSSCPVIGSPRETDVVDGRGTSPPHLSAAALSLCAPHTSVSFSQVTISL